MNRKRLKQYMILVNEVSILQVQKEDLHRKFIQNYSMYNKDSFQKKISDLDQLLQDKMDQIQELKDKELID